MSTRRWRWWQRKIAEIAVDTRTPRSLIAEGRSPAYVHAQVGAASISLTLDTRDEWHPTNDAQAVDSLDDPCRRQSGDQVVTFSSGSAQPRRKS